jgi:hypothetical protein
VLEQRFARRLAETFHVVERRPEAPFLSDAGASPIRETMSFVAEAGE